MTTRLIIRNKDPHVRALIAERRDAYRGTQHGSPSAGGRSLIRAREIGAVLDRISPGWNHWGDDTRGGHAEVVVEVVEEEE